MMTGRGDNRSESHEQGKHDIVRSLILLLQVTISQMKSTWCVSLPWENNVQLKSFNTLPLNMDWMVKKNFTNYQIGNTNVFTIIVSQ